MCLDWLYSEERKKAWLAEQPEVVTCYKGVIVRGSGKLAPLVRVSRAAFKRHNRISLNTKRKWIERPSKDEGDAYVYEKNKNGELILESLLKMRYKPYFHLLTNKKAVVKYWVYQIECECGMTAIVECSVRKEHITAVGVESEELVIVAREFEIMGEV